MGPRTGPRPASSMPRQQGGPRDLGLEVVVGEEGVGGRRDGGTAEKCVYESPERRVLRWIEGGMNSIGAEDSSSMSGRSSVVSSIL
jgi:hypothetical protein